MTTAAEMTAWCAVTAQLHGWHVWRHDPPQGSGYPDLTLVCEHRGVVHVWCKGEASRGFTKAEQAWWDRLEAAGAAVWLARGDDPSGTWEGLERGADTARRES